ncbi:MAG: ectoine synthase [Bacteroidia bacterium]
MNTVNIKQLEGTSRAVQFTGGTSYRAILESEGLGFAVMKTVIPKGGPHKWHYVNHVEACYCIEGRGVLTDLKTGEMYDIRPDIVYYLPNHEAHTFEALEDVVLISIFNPPLKGSEKHDKNGHYSL